MNNVQTIASLMFFVQILHSIEELLTGFHRRWYVFKMPFWVFLTFEIVHNFFWGVVIFTHWLPYKPQLTMFFIALMLVNGIQHFVWSAVTKKYVPGLITAPLHIVLFLICVLQNGF